MSQHVYLVSCRVLFKMYFHYSSARAMLVSHGAVNCSNNNNIYY